MCIRDRYKAQHLYDSWREGGPKNSRYNCTKSGWFDSFCFQDWVESVAIPFFKNVEGPKFLMGDNLASHLSVDVIKLCDEKNIRFIFLPSNSTHLTQPLLSVHCLGDSTGLMRGRRATTCPNYID